MSMLTSCDQLQISPQTILDALSCLVLSQNASFFDTLPSLQIKKPNKNHFEWWHEINRRCHRHGDQSRSPIALRAHPANYALPPCQLRFGVSVSCEMRNGDPPTDNTWNSLSLQPVASDIKLGQDRSLPWDSISLTDRHRRLHDRTRLAAAAGQHLPYRANRSPLQASILLPPVTKTLTFNSSSTTIPLPIDSILKPATVVKLLCFRSHFVLFEKVQCFDFGDDWLSKNHSY